VLPADRGLRVLLASSIAHWWRARLFNTAIDNIQMIGQRCRAKQLGGDFLLLDRCRLFKLRTLTLTGAALTAAFLAATCWPAKLVCTSQQQRSQWTTTP